MQRPDNTRPFAFMASTPPSALVELRNLTFGYGDRVILDDISLSVPRGKVTALMGASGGGKTTILRLIGGQSRAQSGQMLFDGSDVTVMNQSELYAARRRMGMLFQFGALFADLNVFENVAFPLREHTDLPEALIRNHRPQEPRVPVARALCAGRAVVAGLVASLAWREDGAERLDRL